MTRIEQITKAGYTVKVIWECEFDASKIVERKPHSLTHPIVRHGPLNTSDGLYGDRTEAMILHYRIDEDAETIQYCDVTTLYPFVCKYYKFLNGHPIIHVGNICKRIDTCLQMEGLIKCTVVPPKDLYHPVLTYRWKKKLLFCLCRTCVEENNMRGQCHHVTDAEGTISGTWGLNEVRLAVTKGYKVVDIHEVFQYAVTQYYRATGEGAVCRIYKYIFEN